MAETKMDAEMLASAKDVAESIRQAKRGEIAAVLTTVMIAEYESRGRPLGSRKDGSKQAVSVRYRPETFLMPSRRVALLAKPA